MATKLFEKLEDITSLFKELDEKKIVLKVEDGFVGYKCPRGVMTEDIKEILRDNKEAVIAEIQRREA